MRATKSFDTTEAGDDCKICPCAAVCLVVGKRAFFSKVNKCQDCATLYYEGGWVMPVLLAVPYRPHRIKPTCYDGWWMPKFASGGRCKECWERRRVETLEKEESTIKGALDECLSVPGVASQLFYYLPVKAKSSTEK